MYRLLIANLLLACSLIWAWSVLPTIKLPDELKAYAEGYASQLYGRPVTIGGLRVNLRHPLYVAITDLRLANPDWGSTSDMVHIDEVNAIIDVWPLLKGDLRFESLGITGGQVVLERNANGTGNWKPDNASSLSSVTKSVTDLHNAALRDRRRVPVMLKLTIQNSWISFRTSSGAVLKIDVTDGALSAAGDDQPVALVLRGGYNSIPLSLKVAMQSFDAMHASDQPFHADITAVGAGGVVELSTDMMDPLNFDNYHSQLKARFENLGKMAEIFGSQFHADMPIELNARFQRDDTVWSLEDIKGKISGSRGQGNLHLMEGARLHPDHLQLALNFDRADVGDLLARTSFAAANAAKKGAVLHVELKPGILLDARVSIGELSYGPIHFTDLTFRTFIDPGSILLKNISGGFLGGQVMASFRAEAGESQRLKLNAHLLNADVMQVFQASGFDTRVLGGKINAHADISAIGETFDAAKDNSHGFVVLTMGEGSISKKLMRQASTDLRALFGSPSGMSLVSCMLTVMTVDDHRIFLSPFRIRSADGTLFGSGNLDLKSMMIDFAFKTDSNSTSMFALDMPIALTGTLRNPKIRPAQGSIIGDRQGELMPIPPLPSDLNDVAVDSACRN
jgi:uncharacterized protein involved in outer membrane biogenesis